MRLHSSLFAFLLLLAFAATAQTPQLISDFTPGGDGSVDRFNYQGVVYNGTVLMPLSTPDAGLELASISGGNISIVKDINAGPDPSNPRYFTKFNGKVYFRAENGSGGRALWVTDGTEGGTIQVFPTGVAVDFLSELVMSASGNMYFSYGNDLYRTSDGETFDLIKEDALLFTSGRQASPAYTTYQDEIAYLYQDDTTFELYVVEGDSAVLKGSIESTSRFTTVFGLTDLDGALMFGAESSFDPDIQANYIYDPVTEAIDRFNIAGGRARRINPLSSKASLCWVIDRGFYHVSGTGPTIERVDPNGGGSFTQGATMNDAEFDDNYVFVSSGGTFGDDFLVYTDGTEAGSRRLKELVSQQSRFITAGKYAIIGEGVSNNFDPELTLIDMELGTASTIFSFAPLRSQQILSIIPIGVVGSMLYFVNKLDPDVGAEMYSLELDVSTGIRAAIDIDLTLQTNHGQYFLAGSELKNAIVRQYNTAGTLLATQNIQTNSWQQLADYNGAILLNVTIDGKQKTFRVANFKQ